jgi:predicted secreted protein
MASGAVLAQGTLFKIGNGASSEVFTTIPECIKLACPNQKFDILDVTSHDSSGGYREYIPGLIDGENAQADVNMIPSNATHILCRTNALARTKTNFQIIFPGGGTGAQVAFAGYLVGLVPQADAGAVLKETITVKVTGTQTWT